MIGTALLAVGTIMQMGAAKRQAQQQKNNAKHEGNMREFEAQMLEHDALRIENAAMVAGWNSQIARQAALDTLAEGDLAVERLGVQFGQSRGAQRVVAAAQGWVPSEDGLIALEEDDADVYAQEVGDILIGSRKAAYGQRLQAWNYDLQQQNLYGDAIATRASAGGARAGAAMARSQAKGIQPWRSAIMSGFNSITRSPAMMDAIQDKWDDWTSSRSRGIRVPANRRIISTHA